MRVHYSAHDVIKPLVSQSSTIYLIPITSTFLHYVIISFYSNITSSCHETEFETMLSLYFYDAKLRVKQVRKKTCCNLSASKNGRTAKEWVVLFLVDINAYKGRPIYYLLNNLHSVCTYTLVYRPSCLTMDAFLTH